MKKSNKSTKTPAPAKKTAPAPRKAAVAPAPVVKKTAPKTVTTTLTARIDVGFGNTLFVRGEGPGLSWDKGIVMECVGDDRWTITLGESARPLVFKFLVNDEVWSIGEDYSALPGSSVLLAPTF